jgi:hypothetical protein
MEKKPLDLSTLALYADDKVLAAEWPALYDAMSAAYPRLDINAQVLKAHAWEVANPKARKTQRARYLNNWMSRASTFPSEVVEEKRSKKNDF